MRTSHPTHPSFANRQSRPDPDRLASMSVRRRRTTPMSQGASPPDRSNGHAAALAQVQAAWNAAARNWDPPALTAVYTQDALFFGGRPGHCVGADAILDYFASYAGIIESASLELLEQHVLE